MTQQESSVYLGPGIYYMVYCNLVTICC